MPPDYSVADVGPAEWRRLLSPIGALWLALLGYGLVAAGVRAPARPDVVWWSAAAAVALLAWAGIGLIALSSGRLLERLWLSRWPRLGARLTSRRVRRWSELQSAIEASANEATVRRLVRRRNAIALAAPQCPYWIADRWASVGVRVQGAYGLDAARAWPRLWLTLPEPVRVELRRAAARWHRACVWSSWAVLYAVLTPVWRPAGALAMVLGFYAWANARTSIDYRAELVEATFDTHGNGLAEAMGVDLKPRSPLDLTAGHEITARIRKGV